MAGYVYPGFSPFRQIAGNVATVCPRDANVQIDYKTGDNVAITKSQSEWDSEARELLRNDPGQAWDHECFDESGQVHTCFLAGDEDAVRSCKHNRVGEPLCHFSDLDIEVDHVDTSKRVWLRLPRGLRLVNCFSAGRPKQFIDGYNQGIPEGVPGQELSHGAVWLVPSAADYRHDFCDFPDKHMTEYVLKSPIVLEFNSWSRDQKTHQMGGTSVSEGGDFSDDTWGQLSVKQRAAAKRVHSENVDIGAQKWGGMDFAGNYLTAPGGIRRKGGKGYVSCRECEIVLATSLMNNAHLDISVPDTRVDEWVQRQREFLGDDSP
jgi:hypothetical protein